MPEHRRQFSTQFKVEAVQMVIATGKPSSPVLISGLRSPGPTRKGRLVGSSAGGPRETRIVALSPIVTGHRYPRLGRTDQPDMSRRIRYSHPEDDRA